VVRKALILCREAGYELEEHHVNVEKFIPEELMNGTMDEFWEGIKALDADFELKRSRLEEEKMKWRFVATFDSNGARISLREVDSHSPFYDLEGSNNVILLTTERYNEYPMQIKGYGAGAGVTAAGVFADIIRIANI